MIRRARVERGVRIGDRAAAVIVAVELDGGAALLAEQRHQFADLPGSRDADGIRDADAVDAERVHGAVDRQQIVRVGAEGILARKAHDEAVRPREPDALLRAGDHRREAVAVAVRPQVAGHPVEDVDAVHARVDGGLHIAHRAADMREDHRPARHRAEQLRVREGARRGGGVGDLDGIDAEAVERAGDRLFLRRGEVRAGELLALAERRIDDRDVLDSHHEPPSGVAGRR